jgi:serine/threonine protein kinase
MPDPIIIKTLKVPKKVDFSDLRDLENGLLLETDLAKTIQEMGLPEGRYSKAQIGELLGWPKEPKDKAFPVGIIVDKEGEFFTIYKGVKQGKALGEGAFGKVKLVQNMQTGEWKVLKVQELQHKNSEEIAKQEHDNLRLIGASKGSIITRSKSSKSYELVPLIKINKLQPGQICMLFQENGLLRYRVKDFQGKEVGGSITPQELPAQLQDKYNKKLLTVTSSSKELSPFLSDILKIVEKQGHIKLQKDKVNFIMNYAEGKNLFEVLEAERRAQQWSAGDGVRIALQITKQLDQMHSQGLVHCDIKPENILQDAAKKETTIIDVGLALPMEQGKKGLYSTRGTPGYIAPELYGAGLHLYTAASDTFAAGVTLKQMLGFTPLYKDAKGRSAVLNSPLHEDFELEQLLNRMTAPEPKHRPPLSEVIAVLARKERELLPISTQKVGVVYLKEYEDAKRTSDGRAALKQALKSVDIVVLADDVQYAQEENSKKTSLQYYSEVKREIEKETGLPISQEVLISNDPDKLALAARDLILKSQPGKAVIAQVCYFDTGKKVKLPSFAQAIAVTDAKKNYQQAMDACLVTAEQITKVQTVLVKEQARLQEKYRTHNPIVQGRIAALKKTYESLGKPKEPLTYGTLSSTLRALEKEMCSTGKWIHLFKSDGQKSLEKLRTQIEKEGKPEIRRTMRH